MRLPAGSHGVGKSLDAELAQLVPQAGLTSAQTNGVIPASRDRTFPRGSRSPKAEIRPTPPRHHDRDLHEEEGYGITNCDTMFVRGKKRISETMLGRSSVSLVSRLYLGE